MTADEVLYRRYLGGDDEGLNALMERYGDKLTLYLDGYLRDIHEADPSQITLALWQRFSFAMLDLAKRQGWN